MILDLSFELRVNQTHLKSVNDASDKALAPHKEIYELGNIIPWIIWEMAMAPDTGVPILLSKIDLKDGYWRMVVNSKEAWNFAYVLPPLAPIDPPELVIPNVLQMGWSEISAFFYAATETTREIVESCYKGITPIPPHQDKYTVLNINWGILPKPKGKKRTF